MPPKKVHEVKLIRPENIPVQEHGTIGGQINCLMCGLDYREEEYDILFKAKKLAYFDVSCLNFWDAKSEEFKEDKEAIVCHSCLRKVVLKIGNNKKVVKVIVRDGEKTYTCNYYPDKDNPDILEDL